MSERANPDDPQNAANSAWSQSAASNRPAEGAQRANSLQGVEGNWQASEGATDFLGLDADGGAAAPAEAPLGETRAGAGGNAQEWLFHMEHAPAVEVQAATSVGELEPPVPQAFPFDEAGAAGVQALAVEAPAPQEFDAPAQPEDVDAVLDGVLPETAEGDPIAEAAPDQVELPAPASAPRVRRVQWLVAAGLLLALGGAAGWQFWLRKQHGPAVESTSTIVSRPQGGSKSTTARGASELARATKPTTPVPAGPLPVPETPQAGDAGGVVQVPTEDSTPSPEGAAVSGGGAATAVAEAAGGETSAGTSVPDGNAPLGFSPNGIGARPTVVELPPLATPKGARRPERTELGNTWSGNTIPFDSIGGDRQLVTPRVGAVRVLLKNGEHLQGHLHSVGQGHLSVDIALGRMTVDYLDVNELVQIQESDLTKKPSGGLPEETAGLPYVCARVPNGTITGWLVSQDKGKLTLITETAKKLTIDDEGFEPVSKGRSRILGALAKNASSPK